MQGTRSRVLRVSVVGVAWLALTATVFGALFFQSQRTVLLAGHSAVVSPSPRPYAVIRTGPLLPDVRLPSPAPVGVEIVLGASAATSMSDQIERYALVAAAPQGQIEVVRDAVVSLAWAAALRAVCLAAVPPLLWLLVGARRRAQLRRLLPTWYGVLAVAVSALLLIGLWQPWQPMPTKSTSQAWTSLPAFLGADIPLPASLRGVEVSGDVDSQETARLIQSAIGTYRNSHALYSAAAERARQLPLHQPAEGETVALLLTDRHDNIGMDAVHRAVADAAGATVVFTGGDDTSTGNEWEAFSIDSLTAAFADFDKYGVTGNHDFGGFVSGYLADEGWTMLDYQVVPGPGDSLILGADDPRSSGLGAWRDASGTTFAEVADRLAEAACASDRRVGTLLVHDAQLGREALARGCVDLVLGGHLHVRLGPTATIGENGQVGYSYTNGTSGGAAYAIALGKLRRDATSTLITYRDSRPVGIQWVVMQTNYQFVVGDYVALDYLAEPAPTQGPSVG